ncbi:MULTISPECIES: YqbF domain-containing protein [Bacillus cereus group]|uniref:YqbF domain-containing protein n=2 Tax=Bacillus TaxID=1386 RepID=UPI001E4AA0CE|nr:YqbF domain-containing protein [Bacillus paranthracis]MCC2413938.1 YqbF domain-containing protein [Bacillus paranthracis]MDK7492453.1 YqbF domain-containing protein [Bacillus paranthracis]
MYFAKLVGGKTYMIDGHVFTDGVEKVVENETYEYLKGNTLFEVREGEQEDVPSLLDGEKYTETILKKLSKAEQDEIIRSLTPGDFIHDTKNEKERITLILELQEQEA